MSSSRTLADGRAAVVVAALLWGTNGLATSFLPAGVASPTVAAARMLTGGALMLAVCGPDRLRTLRGRRVRGPLLAAALAMAAYQAFYFAAMDLAGVALGTVVTMAGVPVFAGLIAIAGRRGGVTARWLAATGPAVAGGALLAYQPGGGESGVAGVLCGLVAGFGYASFTTAGAMAIRRGADSRAAMAVALLVSGAALGPALLIWPAGWLLTGPGLAVAGYLAAVSTVGAYLLYGRGLRSTAPAVAGTLTLAEPACAALIGLVVLHERLTGAGGAGLALLAGSVAVMAMPGRRRAVDPPAPETAGTREIAPALCETREIPPHAEARAMAARVPAQARGHAPAAGRQSSAR